MKRAAITDAKNHLSRLVDEVKRGASILITDRRKPVARLEPVTGADLTDAERVAGLVRDGLASPPRRRLDLRAFLSREPAVLPAGASAVGSLLSERAGGR